ncbi:MAG: hypothetical protein ACOC0J_00840 [Myxococcota bacterium]
MRSPLPLKPGRVAATGACSSLLLALLSMAAALLPDPAHARLAAGEGSHIRMEILEDRAEIAQVLHLKNEGDTEFSPPGGITIRLPEGAMDLREEEPVKAEASGTSALVSGPFAAGVTVVRLRYALPVQDGRVDFLQHLDLETGSMSVILPEMPGVVATGASVRGIAKREAEGMRFMVVGLAAEEGRLSFELEGLPVRSAWPRWTALFSSLAIVMGGLAMALRDLSHQRRSADRTQEKEEILEALALMEIDRERGIADHEQGSRRREALLARLASVLREEAGRDETA